MALVVCAIEIGTNMSGYAFSHRNDFERDPLMARTNPWHSGAINFVTVKIPTCILIKPDGKTLHSFGYEAEAKYADLAEDGEQKNYFFFKKFQLALGKKLKETFSPTIILEDEMGRSLPALDIFAMSIRFCVDEIMTTISKCFQGSLEKSDILFVLTVPTVWHDVGKQFMREAAIKAGVDRSKIVLESEAILLFCLYLPKENFQEDINVSHVLSQAGTKYMVLDAGDSSTDITVNEIGISGGIREIHEWSIDGCGSKQVNDAFEDMLTTIFSKQVFELFKKQHVEDWSDFSRQIESKKGKIYSYNEWQLTILVPFVLKELYHDVFKDTLAERISKTKFRDEITIIVDKMRVSAKVSQPLFNGPNQNIIRYVEGILRERPVTCILMAGSYSESPLLQHAVKSAFPDIRVVVPENPTLTIMKGSLIYGHTQISENILVQTHDVIDGSDFLSSLNDGSDFIYDICCTPCSGDDKNVEAEYHCEKCQTFFCSICVKHHNKIFKSHKLLAKGEQGFSKDAK